MKFPQKSLSDLEWPRLLEHLAARATGEEAAERCRNLPFLEYEQVPDHLVLISELLHCMREGDPPPALPVYPVGEWLARIRGEGSVPAEALLHIAAALKCFTAIARYLENRRDACPLNAAIVVPADGGVSPLSLARLAAEIESSFEPDGAIADGASPNLGSLRRQVVTLRKRLVQRIEKIAEQEDDLLQERTVTIRNDRFVLPVRADAHRRVSGLVHGASGSGATVYIEPEAVIGIGNDLMLAREEVAREEARVLAGLCLAVRDQQEEVQTALRLTVEVETRIAAARLAQDLEATVPEPVSPGQFDLRGARHPLLALDGVEVVPITVRGVGGQCLVISGPNAGGKTVALKTVGLLGLMLAAGIPIPTDPDSRLGVPRDVLTDIGDDQSLERNLSTFSAHMTNIVSILGTAEDGALVLLDELAAGTDPSEGAALAEALLEQLNDLHATTLATTHFDSLKARAQAGDGFSNAAVGFDMNEMSPTFELRLGTPGSSSALAVARRFGAPVSVIERAKQILPGGVRDLTKAVEALDAERRKAALEYQALADARHAADDSRRRHDEEISRLCQKQTELLDKETGELWAAIRRAREKVREVETSIRRRRTDAAAVTRARKAINEVAEDLDPGGKLSRDDPEQLPGRPASPDDIKPGTQVFVRAFGATGTVESKLKSGRTFVRVGNVKTRVELEDLRVLAPKGKKNKTGSSKRPTPKGVSTLPRPQALRMRENTIDLRGMTVDEAVDATDSFLDRALKEDWPTVFILHGHGTGALRNAVRAYLEESRYVESSRPGEQDEGGDGITVAWLHW